METLRDRVNSGTTCEGIYFKLANDIDLSTKYDADKEKWTPIGSRADDVSLAKKIQRYI